MKNAGVFTSQLNSRNLLQFIENVQDDTHNLKKTLVEISPKSWLLAEIILWPKNINGFTDAWFQQLEEELSDPNYNLKIVSR